MLAVLEGCWSAIRERHLEVPQVVLVVASGSPAGPKQNLKWGHFASLRWQHGEQLLPEVLISGEGLSRPADEVLKTLLHEAAHALADVRSIKDTSRQGRYHNEKFAKLARELGLEPVKDRKLGWSPCTLTDPAARKYRTQIKALSAALRAYRHAEPAKGKERSSSNNGLSCTCDCGRKIRLSRKVFDLGPIDCGVCDTPFTADNSDGGES
ncbi:hypothetical protein [Rhizocola hellebori]|uniref:hypothetical protein n=1 Tax=Rhizocola hellebori TaxID=1392758 RepID=UPI001942E4A4|nr:hypothetical protein [Rhizocola hellebori]